MKIKALVPTGHGINCELETRRALELAGFDSVDTVHLNFLTRGEVDPGAYQLVVFPGGFLDGDDLGAAQACANRIRFSRLHHGTLFDRLVEFVQHGGLVLGICNGFQLLTRLGMLPARSGDYGHRTVSLIGNDSGRFEDRWIHLIADPSSPCVFTRGIQRLYLPIRHGEGKVVSREDSASALLVNAHLAALRYAVPHSTEPSQDYPHNPNGSQHAIAGLCDASGRVFGLMPHPECFIHRTHHPRWTREQLPEEGDGLAIFMNAAAYLRHA